MNPTHDGAVGLVVGATHSDPGCDLSGFNGSILVPGIGAQGGTVESLGRCSVTRCPMCCRPPAATSSDTVPVSSRNGPQYC
ncbi:hypothetical protein G7085_20065 [Tessaracoccus sp. HDW20]|uniref:hypothetical protein n=1 Tax=Tessaracoccus coleopterorum TaxID=2714950 RepID=UPI0018D49EBA|nr:hypothetical protein [Tessaracoccus coleopterorum]NHB86051.1 hypothetical protein [Tessaracoccus coleopterorum]